jgi:hypothetical protein
MDRRTGTGGVAGGEQTTTESGGGMNAKLAKDERKALSVLEEGLQAALDRSRDGFIEAGKRLTVIRDSFLYRETHRTFEDYCQERWGFSRVRAHQLIEAACKPMVNNERQARALIGLDHEDAIAVVQVAGTSGPLSAAKIATARSMIDDLIKQREEKEGRPLDQKERATVQAKAVADAEEEALASRAPAAKPKERDRRAEGLGIKSQIERLLRRWEESWNGEPDLEGFAVHFAAIRKRMDRLKELAAAA